MLNLSRSPFLSVALEYIKNNPGVTKRNVVLGLNNGKLPPARTTSGQYRRINDLIHAGLVENRGNVSKYELHFIGDNNVAT